MERLELIELVNRIKLASDSEEIIDSLIDLFLKNVPDPNAADYIFHEDFTSEEIVDKALKYRPINL